MFNLKKNLFLEGKMQSLCSGKISQDIGFFRLVGSSFSVGFGAV